MKLLAVVTPLYIYHGCPTWKTFWEEKFTGEERFTLGELSAVNMKQCGCCNVRKHREIKVSEKYFTLDMLLLPSKTSCEVYDESGYPQLGQLPCKNINYWYETDPELASLFYEREQVKRVPI